MNRPSSGLRALPTCLSLLVLACGPSSIAPAAPGASTEVVVPLPATAAPSACAAVQRACIAPADRPHIINLDDPRPAKTFASAADSSAAVKTACDRIDKRRARAEKAGPGGPDPLLDNLGRCFPSAKGAWALDTKDPKKVPPDQYHNAAGWEVRYELTYVAPDGRLFSSTRIEGAALSQVWETRSAEVLGLFDYDGDGVSEILIVLWKDSAGEDHESTRALMTFRDGEVTAYAPAEKLSSIDAMFDADSDGRPDLMLPGSMRVEGPCGYDGQVFGSPWQIAHSLPNGQFSLDDEIAQEIVRAQCGSAPRDLLSVDRSDGAPSLDPSESVRRSACARIYGMSAKEAQLRIRERYPFPVTRGDDPDGSEPGQCMSLAMLLDLAGQTPPFTTAPPCAGP